MPVFRRRDKSGELPADMPPELREFNLDDWPLSESPTRGEWEDEFQRWCDEYHARHEWNRARNRWAAAHGLDRAALPDGRTLPDWRPTFCGGRRA